MERRLGSAPSAIIRSTDETGPTLEFDCRHHHSIDFHCLVVESRKYSAYRNHERRRAGAFCTDPQHTASADIDNHVRQSRATLDQSCRTGLALAATARRLISSLAGFVILYPLLHTSPLISIFDRNGISISAHESAEIQKLLSLGVLSLWIGIMVVGAVYAWRLVWLTWNAMPQPVGAPRSNGMAHL